MRRYLGSYKVFNDSSLRDDGELLRGLKVIGDLLGDQFRCGQQFRHFR